MKWDIIDLISLACFSAYQSKRPRSKNIFPEIQSMFFLELRHILPLHLRFLIRPFNTSVISGISFDGTFLLPGVKLN